MDHSALNSDIKNNNKLNAVIIVANLLYYKIRE